MEIIRVATKKELTVLKRTSAFTMEGLAESSIPELFKVIVS